MISLEKVRAQSGGFLLTEISLEVPEGGYGVLMGRTGAGKTTLLEAVCGLRPVLAGRVYLGESDITELPPAARGIGYVPQDRALFHSMSVQQNLAFAPSVQGWPRATIAERVAELAELLRLGPLLDRSPSGLSGGEAQRVALGRALAARPRILLLDEPLNALDDETWESMIDLLQQVRRRTGVTTLHVTHRREEARRLADRIFILQDGIVRNASPADLPEKQP